MINFFDYFKSAASDNTWTWKVVTHKEERHLPRHVSRKPKFARTGRMYLPKCRNIKSHGSHFEYEVYRAR